MVSPSFLDVKSTPAAEKSGADQMLSWAVEFAESAQFLLGDGWLYFGLVFLMEINAHKRWDAVLVGRI